MDRFRATSSMNIDLIAEILDSECDPPSPYEIELHCAKLSFSWVRVKHGYWIENDSVWIPGEYIITNFESPIK